MAGLGWHVFAIIIYVQTSRTADLAELQVGEFQILYNLALLIFQVDRDAMEQTEPKWVEVSSLSCFRVALVFLKRYLDIGRRMTSSNSVLGCGRFPLGVKWYLKSVR